MRRDNGNTMSKLLGVILLVIGCVMLFYGWQAHQAASVSATGAVVSRSGGGESMWLLTMGTIAVVWGLVVSLRRRV
jgi:hypothetical protein